MPSGKIAENARGQGTLELPCSQRRQILPHSQDMADSNPWRPSHGEKSLSRSQNTCGRSLRPALPQADSQNQCDRAERPNALALEREANVFRLEHFFPIGLNDLGTRALHRYFRAVGKLDVQFVPENDQLNVEVSEDEIPRRIKHLVTADFGLQTGGGILPNRLLEFRQPLRFHHEQNSDNEHEEGHFSSKKSGRALDRRERLRIKICSAKVT